MTTVIILSGTSWTVPADWTSTNTAEAFGGGAGGSNGYFGCGGGGGGYGGKLTGTALTPGNSVTIQVGGFGTGGAEANNAGNAGTNGGITWWNGANQAASTVSANGGSGGVSFTGGLGATTTGCTGTTLNVGGNGGTGSSGGNSGGGGAGGPNGAGKAGGAGSSSGAGGSGGGGSDGGTAGGTTSTNSGANGGDNFAGSGHGTGSASGAGGNATVGGGGGGAGGNSSGTAPGGAGGNGITAQGGTAGSGGGGGAGSQCLGSGQATGGAGGNYGGGGASGGFFGTTGTLGGAGGPGAIVLTYTSGPLQPEWGGSNQQTARFAPVQSFRPSSVFPFPFQPPNTCLTPYGYGIYGSSDFGCANPTWGWSFPPLPQPSFQPSVWQQRSASTFAFGPSGTQTPSILGWTGNRTQPYPQPGWAPAATLPFPNSTLGPVAPTTPGPLGWSGRSTTPTQVYPTQPWAPPAVDPMASIQPIVPNTVGWLKPSGLPPWGQPTSAYPWVNPFPNSTLGPVAPTTPTSFGSFGHPAQPYPQPTSAYPWVDPFPNSTLGPVAPTTPATTGWMGGMGPPPSQQPAQWVTLPSGLMVQPQVGTPTPNTWGWSFASRVPFQGAAWAPAATPPFPNSTLGPVAPTTPSTFGTFGPGALIYPVPPWAPPATQTNAYAPPPPGTPTPSIFGWGGNPGWPYPQPGWFPPAVDPFPNAALGPVAPTTPGPAGWLTQGPIVRGPGLWLPVNPPLTIPPTAAPWGWATGAALPRAQPQAWALSASGLIVPQISGTPTPSTLGWAVPPTRIVNQPAAWVPASSGLILLPGTATPSTFGWGSTDRALRATPPWWDLFQPDFNPKIVIAVTPPQIGWAGGGQGHGGGQPYPLPPLLFPQPVGLRQFIFQAPPIPPGPSPISPCFGILAQLAAVTGVPTPPQFFDRSTIIQAQDVSQNLFYFQPARSWCVIYNPCWPQVQLSLQTPAYPYHIVPPAQQPAVWGVSTNLELGPGEAYLCYTTALRPCFQGAISIVGLIPGMQVCAWEGAGAPFGPGILTDETGTIPITDEYGRWIPLD